MTVGCGISHNLQNTRVFTVLNIIKLNVSLKFLYVQQVSYAICTVYVQKPSKNSCIAFKYKNFIIRVKTACV